ncbi:hypothetical protein VNO77_28532 [Canavalia gladiata]|uniref:Uncharacterized protein n=1 Tax=Canavalia gladiata TaxID=3824 RepID=A0AAN9KXA2_CANGL
MCVTVHLQLFLCRESLIRRFLAVHALYHFPCNLIVFLAPSLLYLLLSAVSFAFAINNFTTQHHHPFLPLSLILRKLVSLSIHIASGKLCL